MRSRNIKTGPGGFFENNPVCIFVNFSELSIPLAEVLLSSGVPLRHYNSIDTHGRYFVRYVGLNARCVLPSRTLSSSTLEADVLTDVMKAFNELAKENKPTTGRNGKPIIVGVFDDNLFR